MQPVSNAICQYSLLDPIVSLDIPSLVTVDDISIIQRGSPSIQRESVPNTRAIFTVISSVSRCCWVGLLDTSRAIPPLPTKVAPDIVSGSQALSLSGT